jgi:cation diffusion facilitator CzcD-associated flavoprotein CzcO
MVDHPHSPLRTRQIRRIPRKYLQFRYRIESQMNRAQLTTWRGTPANKAFSEATDKSIPDRLVNKPEIYESLRPDYPVACRRISPGPRYLEVLTKENVEFIPKEIQRITEKGIIDEDGVEREVDTIICATGFDT